MGQQLWDSNSGTALVPLKYMYLHLHSIKETARNVLFNSPPLGRCLKRKEKMERIPLICPVVTESRNRHRMPANQSINARSLLRGILRKS
jgi:hypothetical protein